MYMPIGVYTCVYTVLYIYRCACAYTLMRFGMIRGVLVCYGVTWYDMAWYDMLWCGLVWDDMPLSGMVC